MTIQWGTWEYSGGNGMRVGIEVTNSSVSHSSASVTFTYKVYTENQYVYSDDETLTFGSTAGSGSTTFHNGSGGGSQVLRATRTWTWTYYSDYGGSPGTVSFSAAVSGTYNGVTPSQLVTSVIPGRPYGIPAPPTATAAVRNTDASATVSWARHATAGEPYTSQTIAMRTYTGSAWSAYAVVATASGTATSYTKTGLSANHAYQFEVRANNSAGSSVYDTSNNAYMTPAAPTAVSASLGSTGSTIAVKWTNNHYVYTGITMTVERSVAGGAYAAVATGLVNTTTTWTDPSPGAGTNAYRVKAVNAVGTLSSAYGVSNTVSTLVAPVAPTQLAPNGRAVDLNLNQTLTWKHNPGGDNAPQTHFDIQYSTNGGSSWTNLVTNVASSTSSYTIPAGTLPNGGSRLWRVRTEGVASAGFGPYSASATLIGSSTPTVTITSPGASITALPFDVSWDYDQAELTTQAQWQATLYAADGTTPLQTVTDLGPASVMRFSYPYEDNTDYVIGVKAQSVLSIWSSEARLNTHVHLLPPAAIDLTATYQPTTGTTLLSLIPETEVGGVTVPVVSAVIERQVPGSDEWVVLFPSLDMPNEIIDPLPAPIGTTVYRVTSVSATPSYYLNPTVNVTPDNPLSSDASPDSQWVFVNYGDAFAELLRFRSEPQIKESAGREKVVQAMAGRRKPILLLGTARNRQVSADGVLVYDNGEGDPATEYDSPPGDWETAAQEAEVVCYRDFTGRRMFGSLSDVDTGDTRPGLATVSFSVTEIDYTESYGG